MPTTEPIKEHRGAWRELAATVAAPSTERVTEALQMVEAFESVGVTAFDVTLTDQRRRKLAFKENRPSSGLRDAIVAGYLFECEARKRNIIVRPIGDNSPRLLQLDDLTREKADELAPLSFLTLETSPGNYQIWMAVEGLDEEAAREVKRSIGADINASGAVRLAGSMNFKATHAPHFPTVRLHASAPGRTTSTDVLEQLGILPARLTPAEFSDAGAKTIRTRTKRRKWPSYERCLQDAPAARTHRGPDRSHADFTFALFAIERGFTEEEVAAELVARSEKAKEKGGSGPAYAAYTAHRAAEVAAKGKRPRP